MSARTFDDDFEQLRAGDSRGRQAKPTSLTVSNLGGSNVETFTAVVNTPEAAILAVGKIMPSAVVVDGKVARTEYQVVTRFVTPGKLAREIRITTDLNSNATSSLQVTGQVSAPLAGK